MRTRILNGVEFTIDYDRDGVVEIKNPKTLETYHELRDKQSNINTKELGMFFAFSNAQFYEGYNDLIKRGFIKDGDKVIRYKSINGAFGIDGSIEKFYEQCREIDNEIKEKCNPQEVYLYEYNNYESFINWEGDSSAYETIVNTFGEDIANTIVRL